MRRARFQHRFLTGKGGSDTQRLTETAWPDFDAGPIAKMGRHATLRETSRTERSAAWLAHQSGGLGVVGSNPAAPTIYFQMVMKFSRFAFSLLGTDGGTFSGARWQRRAECLK